ncbi:bacterial low temperature requirement A protein-domain-containing protein [Gongronella butleri]|nr:bacterial low temperature requirement A protein-domain-containing protein [Gongronella butleri]
MSTRRTGTMRRGPTMRGVRRGPTILRTYDNDEHAEEFRALNDASGLTDDDDDVEMQQLDINDEKQARRRTFEMHQETMADALRHPIEEFHAHQLRKSGQIDQHSDQSKAVDASHDYIVVVHFRQLRGNQRFTLDHQTAEHFANKVRLTPQQRIQFNGVHDTDGLTAFLYKCKIEFAIKIHHKAELARIEHQVHEDLAHHIEHNPDHETMAFSENVFVEFKPKTHHHEAVLPVEASRRPFFRYPEPDLTADIGVEKAASWLELFYDLFYVATLTQFTHSHVIKDWATLGTYTSWFVITWWAWISSSLYTARFDTDDVVHHVWKWIEMCAVICMAGNSMYFLTSRGYVLGYIALKAVLVVEYSIVLIVAIRIRSKSKVALSMYVLANLVSIGLWAGSLLILEMEIHRLLWYLGILVEVLVNILVQDKRLSWAASHLAERLGLLTLIVLGENLMNLVSFVAVTTTEILMMIPNFMAVAIIFGFFFMYFEDFNKEVFLHNKYHQTWTYLHFPLHLLQVAFGISLIDTLKVYKKQMTDAGKLHEPEFAAHGSGSASEGDHAPSGASGGEHAPSGASGGEHAPSGASSGENAAPSGSTDHASSGAAAGNHAATPTPSAGGHANVANAHVNEVNAIMPTHAATTTPVHAIAGVEHAHRLARRAIADVQQQQQNDDDYNPMDVARLQFERRNAQHEQKRDNPEFYRQGYLTLGKYALQSLAATVLHAALAAPDASSATLDASSPHHHLMKRSGAAAEGESDILTDEEKVFVYKTFLMFGGGIIVVNSLIKLLNTKLTDMNGKIIIGSRLLVATILWCMCAIPFATLDAIYLLAGMVGAVILLALIDLLD